ncbi:hypothetical protein HK100_002124 [Physocladia obscura]|uniref:Uncharacterized protein n=1 Tax=Physocladia obscura TaxID=109957 RepID=A0AAD5SVS8_9FUNG|nr:hypothetical protein HK100_002124 [Physocladia obscura]
MQHQSQRRVSVGNVCADEKVEIRDFAYRASDARHFGAPGSASFAAHSKGKAKNTESENANIDEKENERPPEILANDEAIEKHVFLPLIGGSDDDDDDDDNADDDNPSLHVTNRFPFLLEHIRRALNATTAAKPPLHVARAKALFDFVKGADCEMDIQENNHLLLVTTTLTSTATISTSATATTTDKKSDRFASIEDLNSVTGSAASPVAPPPQYKTASVLKMLPEAAELRDHLQEFLDMQEDYGVGWVVALKINLRNVGGGVLTESIIGEKNIDVERVRVVHRFVARLVDIGLVPLSYVG